MDGKQRPLEQLTTARPKARESGGVLPELVRLQGAAREHLRRCLTAEESSGEGFRTEGF
jgi:hypothetical protein